MKLPVLIAVLAVSASASAANLPYSSIVQKYSAKYGLDPLLVHALIQQESGHRPGICSGAGACGLMQLMPGTAKELGLSPTERSNPERNVAAGTMYLRRLLGSTNGIMPHALYSYNWGIGNFKKYQRGVKKVMPEETRQYVPKIARYYHQFGGKGSFFASIQSGNGKSGTSKSEGIKNPNQSTIQNQQNSDAVCPRVSLPEQTEASGQPSVVEIVGGAGGMAGVTGGGDRLVFDPAKVTQLITAIEQTKQSLEVMRGEYDALTKGMAGFDLLTNIASIAGYKLPQRMDDNVMVKWGNAADATLFQQIQEMKAADTGIYASQELEALTNKNAEVINRAYAETEMAWSLANCASNNLQSLMTAKPKTQKQAKDLANAIKVETAMIEANQTKIKVNMTMMSSAYQSYRIGANQIYVKWQKGIE